MKKSLVFSIIFVLLTGCVNGTSYGGDTAHESLHRTLHAAGISSVHVVNVSGPITVRGTGSRSITIDATKSGNDADALRRTHVTIEQQGAQLVAHTEYDQGGGWFSSHNGATVAYVIAIPPDLSVDLSNVSGPVTVAGTTADVKVQEVSGSIKAWLGTVRSNRRINIQSVSGPVTLSIGRNSDVHVQTKTVSGAIHAFFPANIEKGLVGETLEGRLGKGDATVTIGAISGEITISAE